MADVTEPRNKGYVEYRGEAALRKCCQFDDMPALLPCPARDGSCVDDTPQVLTGWVLGCLLQAHLASASEDGTVRIWDEDYTQCQLLSLHDGAASVLRASPETVAQPCCLWTGNLQLHRAVFISALFLQVVTLCRSGISYRRALAPSILISVLLTSTIILHHGRHA